MVPIDTCQCCLFNNSNVKIDAYIQRKASHCFMSGLEVCIAATRHKLSSLKISRSVDLINVGNEISRLIDMIYVEESHKDR
uniref:DUF3077 domain-containing protein n=1 Tax=Strongyloides venezuelensis TaxID=75913 RepID=A0A0K0FEH8_STRVS